MENKLHIRAVEVAGGPSALAKKLEIKPQAISQWKRIPAGRVIDVEKVTGIPREELRPDLYPAPASERETSSEEEAASNFCPRGMGAL